MYVVKLAVMRYLVYVWLGILLCLTHWCSAKDINVFSQDTVWIVNYQYSQLERDTFDFRLPIPELPPDFQEYNFVRIFWGTQKAGLPECSALINATDLPKEYRHKYPSGKYFLTIKYYKNSPVDENTPEDKKVCFWIFNQDLQGHIAIRGIDGCIESGVDTFYVKMTDHLDNPPGTKYFVDPRTDAPGKDPWRISPNSSLIKDSAMVIFSAPTGTFGADIRFRMVYKEDEKSTLSRTNVTEWRTVHVYKTPDLREMFNFRDTLVEGENMDAFKKIEVCTNEELTAMSYDSLINVKYTYVDNLPMYNSRGNFRVEYYRKDSIAEKNWKNVTADTAMVDTAGMKFKYPGFYKIKMVAFNQCGTDSLSTDSIRNREEKRHIIVYQGGTNVIRCDEDTICGVTPSREISFMDTGKRFEWDPVPEYKFVVTRSVDTLSKVDTIEIPKPLIHYYKDGALFDPGNAEQFGCDSTLLKIRLVETGIYNIALTRSRYCDPPVTYNHKLIIGDIPLLPKDTLWKHLGQEVQNPLAVCDTFKFTLPEVKINQNFMDVDSVRWCFQKGTVHLDTVLQEYGVANIYRFDSIGNAKSYMTLQVHNFCGWSLPEKAELYTNLTPRVKLLRDSLASNDSLCVNVKYKYYWEGKLPDKYRILGTWDKGLKVNGQLIFAGNPAFLASSVPEEQQAGIPAVGEIEFENQASQVNESIVIQNQDNIRCKQEIKGTFTVLAIPDQLIYDTIRYCSNVTVLKTETLFHNNPPQLKYVEWKWNNEPATLYQQANYNPEFVLNPPSKTDSLYAKIFNSKGCYLKDTVILEPQALPVLELGNKNVEICADDTIRVSEYTGSYITNTNGGSVRDMHLKVYKDRSVTASLVFDTLGASRIEKDIVLNHVSGDTVRLIYELSNDRVTQGFGDCFLKDTVTVKVWKPLILISGIDTIRDLSLVNYSFTGPSVRIDTADISDEGIVWNILNGKGTLNDSKKLKPVYTIHPDDKILDTLIFELTGKSKCGVQLRDSLVVYLPKEELWVKADTICNNYLEYNLWGPGKTYGKFINLQTIQWRLLSDKNGINLGVLSADKGQNVTYKSSFDAWQADTVKIEVKAWNLYDLASAGSFLQDTIFLKVNHAPENIYPDTLYLKADTPEGRKILFEHIKLGRSGVLDKSKGYCQEIIWDWVKAEGSGAGFYPNNTRLGMNIGTPPVQNKNYSADLKVTMKGLPGCADSQYDVVLTGVLPPKVSLSNFDICDKGSVVVDTGFLVKGKDRFTLLEWEHNGKGYFTPGIKEYQAVEGDIVNLFSLKATKNFTLYNDTPAEYTHSASGNVHLYRKPDFTLYDGAMRLYTHDTLCMGDSNFTYERGWVDGNYIQANYTKENLTAVKSTGLTGNFPNFLLNDGVTQARLVVSTDFGSCKMWENIADTLYITRLTEMTGGFDIPVQLCEGGRLVVNNVQVDPRAESYFWTAVGGTIDQSDIQHPVFTSSGAGEGSISMIITPPRGCQPNTEIKKALTMIQKPSLLLRDTIICDGMGVTLNFERHPQVKSVSWKANGRHFATTTTESAVHYAYKSSDIIGDKVQIVGEITPEIPCTEVILSNVMTVSYQKKAQINGSLQGVVCQGDSLDLSADIVSAINQSGILWSVEESAGKVLVPDKLNTIYVPGEISGNQVLNIKAYGLHGCPDVSSVVNVVVNKSILPEISVPNIKCAGAEIRFSHMTSDQPKEAAGTWYVNGVKEAETWYTFTKAFAAAGEYQIRFTTTYNGKCPRSVEQAIHVNPLPQVNFSSQPDSIIGSGKEVEFINQTPGTISYQWDFYGKGTEIKDENGVHIHRFDLVDEPYLMTNVTLSVKDGNKCQGTKSKVIKVVNAPDPKFEIVSFDHCTGDIKFINLTEGEDVSYYWNLGNGSFSEDTVPLNFAYTPVFKDSTYTVSLKVKNEAGEKEYTQDVKMISLLKPKFIISPDKAGCEGRQAAKGFSNRTEGKADLYTFKWGDHSPDGVYVDFFPFPVYHKYSNPEPAIKKFMITLTAANACYTKEYIDSISIYPNVISTEFIPDKTRICFGNEITFKNESFGFGADAQAWWMFGSGANPIENNDYEVIHRFNKPGVYPVKLVMTDRCNSDTSAVVNINILGDLSLDFGMEAGPYCSGQGIEMKVFPELKDKFTNYHWDFGDGYPASAVDSVMQRFQYAGKYSVRLSANAVSEGSCPVTTAGKLVEVNETPFASISPVGSLSGCAPYIIDKLSRVGIGNEQVFWDFKNGDTSTDAEVYHVTFENPGEYPILLRLTSPAGCVDTARKTIVVKKSPRPAFTVSDSLICTLDGSIHIGLENHTPEADLSSFEWSYNGQLPFSRNEQPGILKLDNMFGEVLVKLSVTNRLTGCFSDFSRKVLSGQVFKLQVNIDTTMCHEQEVEIKNSASDIHKITWDLGDGTYETENAFFYVYRDPGKYNLKVTGENEAGCKDSLIKTMTVYPLPIADFSYHEDRMSLDEMKLPSGVDISKLPDVKNGILRFTNHSSIDKYDFTTGKLKSFWNFGDGSQVILTDEASHHFSNNGHYEVKLVVKGDYGCADSITQLISVDAVKGLFIPNAFAPATGVQENPGLALFQPKGIGLISYKIQVYDQWGTCVWSSTKLENGHPAEAWDGTFKGQPLPKNLYTWKVSAVFIDGTVWEDENGRVNGQVMLIR